MFARNARSDALCAAVMVAWCRRSWAAEAHRSRRARVLLGCVAFSACCGSTVVGCSLDTRVLHSEFTIDPLPGDAGSTSQPTGHAGSGTSAAGARAVDQGGASGVDDSGGAPTSSAGSSGGPSPQPPLVNGCPDLDGNGVGDCQETLVSNGDFKADVRGWTPDSETVIVWDKQNASTDLPSGSALVSVTSAASAGTAGSVLRVASQCLAIAGKQLVTAYANTLVAGDQAADGHAEIDVYLFDAAGCTGSYATSFSTPQPTDGATDHWLTVKAGAVSGANTQSALVSLALSKPLNAASFSARFDNVLLKKQAL